MEASAATAIVIAPLGRYLPDRATPDVPVAVMKSKPKLKSGPVRGEITMAPMMTGALFVIRMERAIRVAKVSMAK
jgi:hypothetical protein